MSEFFAAQLPRKFAHRGASGTHPENTMEAFRAAIERGAEGFELDVHRSADGHVVVFHDDMLERTTNGSGPIRERSLADLRELDAGFRFSPDGGR
ncbi:MAG TPA: glycerophosphodiester phosphodiesterase family protein, partial [Gemmatimonadota bacterium]|nr:glycerophosphodiester phosphodiesterase family protein [Gemmatimonadota bacterium]